MSGILLESHSKYTRLSQFMRERISPSSTHTRVMPHTNLSNEQICSKRACTSTSGSFEKVEGYMLCQCRSAWYALLHTLKVHPCTRARFCTATLKPSRFENTASRLHMHRLLGEIIIPLGYGQREECTKRDTNVNVSRGSVRVFIIRSCSLPDDARAQSEAFTRTVQLLAEKYSGKTVQYRDPTAPPGSR